MSHVTAYLARVEATLRTGDATEHSHRPALQALLEAAGLAALGRPPSVVNEPRRTRVGAPDFIVRLAGAPVGYAEAKDVGVALDAETEQMRRYRAGLRNLLFTDGLAFVWFADGAERDRVTLAEREGRAATVRLREAPGGATALADLLGAFFRFEAPAITTARELATRMAAATQLLDRAIADAFTGEAERGALHQQFDAFREVLIHDLTPVRFADMYAQTLAYGLFAARAASPTAEGFSRLTAAAHLPRTNPFLQKLFYEVAGPDLDDRIAWLVDDLALLLARSDLATVLADFGRRTRREDAVVHFYETFLQAYNPVLREMRGVYYTPEPVVGWLVRSVEAVLARDFGLPDGLADASTVDVQRPGLDGAPARAEAVHRVQILDPATGTGTFLHAVLRAVHARFAGNEGLWDAYVADHLLPRVHGFELLMAPYTVAHLKLGLFLQETGYTFSRDERLGVFLTNTLDDAGRAGETPIPFARWLAEEATAADRVKRDTPVMVVVGNPPYSGHSTNTGEWITRLMRGEDVRAGRRTESYFEVDGEPLGEKNPKWLNDDYVKFVRMAQEQVARTGQGVVALVTNHGFLDNPTFRGMRQSLAAVFDRLYVLDLHGNAKKKEAAPDGGRDENVFDIMQGVSLSVFVRTPGFDAARPAEVYHADLWGPRADKYAALDATDVTTTAWTRLDPRAPAYLFRPEDREHRDEYDAGWKVTDIFPVSNTGMVTARDAFVLGFDRAEVLARVRDFAALPLAEAASTYTLRDTRERTLDESQKMVRAMADPADRMQTVLYRPFDERAIFYDKSLVRWPVSGLMRHMLSGENVALAIGRAGAAASPGPWDIQFASAQPTDFNLFRRGGNTLFPLWLYPEPETGLFAAPASARTANLAPAFTEALAAATGLAYAETPFGGTEEASGGTETTAWQTEEASGGAEQALGSTEHASGGAEMPSGVTEEPSGGAEMPSGDSEKLARAGSPADASSAHHSFSRHSRESGNPESEDGSVVATLDSRVRGNDGIRGLGVTPTPTSGSATPASFTPEDAFHYVYGVLHAPAYRARYAGFLRADYPRVPLPPTPAAFRALADVGRRLVAVHLLRDVPAGSTRFPVKGSNTVEPGYPKYVLPGAPGPDGETAADGRVFLNAAQYVGGVEPEVWAHEVGGYQPLAKWLKDRRGRALSYADLRRYPQIVAALRHTQRLMAEADRAAEAFGW